MFTTLTYVVCIDKLALNLKSEQVFDYQRIIKFPKSGNVYRVSPEVSLRLQSSLTKNYRHSWEMWINDIHVGDLSTDCTKPQKLKAQRFAFKNEILYTLPGWSYYLGIIQKSTGLRYSSIGILEIALDIQYQDRSQDTTALLRQLDDIFKYLPRKHNTDIRYRPVQGRLSITEREGTYYFGGSYTSPNSSGKQIVAYCKSAEILNNGKGYISEFHADNGLDICRPVVRIEDRCTSKFFRGLPSFHVLQLLDQERLEALFLDAVGTSFQFQDLSESTRDAHRNLKHAVVTLFDFSFLNQQPVVRQQHSVAHEASSDNSNVRTVKRLTIDLIRHRAEPTVIGLRHFIRVNPAPHGQCWYRKIQQYAQSYPDKPGPKQMAMIESIVSILKHTVPA
ncbi:hypothetical protein KBK19_13625 [Microvirga sp. STR05]|uniref:Uncharacterized protein n=1 Tax=Hymenobacter duratus TaxID=2771356 RepID=A0ABR8JGU5_9BACT|nr:hypothetical protein [Hymenobacter duratus]MBD2716077.1 hypothetical protein [Hymenobacter duratus]MBR7950991.1 hypothetical protein [Microvirga sp. STR05]